MDVRLSRPDEGVIDLFIDGRKAGEIRSFDLRNYAKQYLRLVDDGRAAPVPRFARERLSQLSASYARTHGLSEEAAQGSVVKTEEGKRLWEEARMEELEESANSARGR